MQIIIDHFDKFPLITIKLKDYKLFKLAYILFLKKEQLSIEGIKKLVSIKSEMNLGLSLELKASFSDTIRLSQPSVEKENNTYHSLYLVEKKSYNIPDPNWIAGFASGEACFIVDVAKSNSNKIGSSVNLRITISQHARDELLLCNLINYFNCGKLYKNNNCFNLTIRKFADIDTKIIPFFLNYPIIGQKLLDFQDFCR